jgi:large subunit ribosomal protein L32
MGGVPKQRHTKSRRNKRRMHHFIDAPSLSVCPKCKKPVLLHTVCQSCGYYKGAEVIDVMKKLTKKEKKQKEKEMKAAQEAEGKQNSKKEVSLEELSKK